MAKIFYGWDAYCGWCYGFDSIFTDFVANHPDLQIEMFSGGLFVGDNSKNIGAYGYFEDGNKQITKTYGVEFGDTYNAAIAEGSMVLNSVHPALGFIVMMA